MHTYVQMRMHHTRVEKCGQRGVLAKYCLHFHKMSNASESSFVGNAVEYSHQRGVIIHGTHLTTTAHNVFHNVRGANIYLEDGNELDNHIDYNVAVCGAPHNDDDVGGCTLPGTPNGQADTALNLAGIWALGFGNHITVSE